MEKKKKDKNSSSFIPLIKKLWSNPRGKGILFFGGYFLFFLALILVLRFSTRGDVIGTGYEKGNPYTFSVSNITNQNYEFQYQFIVDGRIYQYEGKRYQSEELFTFLDGVSSTSYYRKGDSYFQNQTALWVKANNPYFNSSFTNIDTIGEILGESTFVSKTDYESGKQTYLFQVASATLGNLLTKQDIDIEEIPNQISLSTDEDRYVNKIQFSLDSYGRNQNICKQTFQIVLEYDNYGEIEEIESPID